MGGRAEGSGAVVVSGEWCSPAAALCWPPAMDTGATSPLYFLSEMKIAFFSDYKSTVCSHIIQRQ